MLSVVIPTLDHEEPLALTLASLVPAAADGTVREVVVVDGGSRDDTRRVADVTGCVLVERPGHLSERLAAGAAASSRGEWLLFLEPGVVLDPRWEVEVATFVERTVRGGRAGSVAAVFSYALDDVAAGARLREFFAGVASRLTGLPDRAQGVLIAREHYRRLGGYRPLPALEDVDLVLRIGRGRVVRLRSRAAVVRPAGGSARRRGAVAGLRRGLSRTLAALRVPVGLLTGLHGRG